MTAVKEAAIVYAEHEAVSLQSDQFDRAISAWIDIPLHFGRPGYRHLENLDGAIVESSLQRYDLPPELMAVEDDSFDASACGRVI